MRVLIYGICLVVFCLPLYLVRFEVFGIPTTVLEIMIYILFIIWLTNKLIRKWIKGQLLMRSQRKLSFLNFIPILLILIGVSLATIFSSDLRISAGIWKAWFIDPILFFIVLVSVVKTSKQVKKILFSLFLSGIVVSIIALVYLILGKLDPIGRLQAFFNSPNYLAMFLAPALAIGVGNYLFTFLGHPSEAASGTSPSLPLDKLGDHARSGCVTRKKIIPNTFTLLSVVGLLLSIFFAHSYGAWLGIIAAIGLGLFIYFLKSRKKLAWIILCLSLAVILTLGYFALIQRAESFEARLIIWQKSLKIFKTNPIIGIGPGTFGNYFPAYPEWGVPQPHNIFLAFLLQTGIIGFIGFIWLLIWFYKTPLNGVKKISIVLITIMTYMLVHGLVDTTYWKNDLSVIFWILIALCYITNRRAYLQRKDILQEGKEIN